jgi:hypothetical protein
MLTESQKYVGVDMGRGGAAQGAEGEADSGDSQRVVEYYFHATFDEMI